MKKIIKKITVILFLALVLTSCATIKSWFSPIAKFDQKTYENLTSLKVELNQFIGTLNSDNEKDKVEPFYIIFDKVFEYEKGKGLSPNYETIEQLKMLRERIDVFVNEAKIENLSFAYRNAKKETLSRILDIIIATEYDKPR